MVELVSDADERAVRFLRRAENVEQCGALLDQLEEAAVRLELLAADLAEQVGRAADVETLLRGENVDEDRANRREERALANRQALIFEAAAEQRRAELEAGDGLVQVLAGPLREPRIDRRRRTGTAAS